jgi:hypothetical protein
MGWHIHTHKKHTLLTGASWGNRLISSSFHRSAALCSISAAANAAELSCCCCNCSCSSALSSRSGTIEPTESWPFSACCALAATGLAGAATPYFSLLLLPLLLLLLLRAELGVVETAVRGVLLLLLLLLPPPLLLRGVYLLLLCVDLKLRQSARGLSSDVMYSGCWRSTPAARFACKKYVIGAMVFVLIISYDATTSGVSATLKMLPQDEQLVTTLD